jgi:hypothetical protein
MRAKPDLSPERRDVGYESDLKENEPEGEEINAKMSGDIFQKGLLYCLLFTAYY